MSRVIKFTKELGIKGLKLYVLDKLKLSISTNICPPGMKKSVKLRANTSDIDVFFQIFVKKEYQFNYRPDLEVIIDAGANIGMTSLYFAAAFPDARIFALEPEDSNYELLKENTRAYPNIIPLHCALWHRNAALKIANPKASKFSFEVRETDGIQSVQAVTIEDLIRDYDLKFIDILKVDIEGAEKQVFSNTRPWITQIGLVIAELHDSHQVGCSRAFYTALDPFIREEFMVGENIFVETTNQKPVPGAV
ncbi:FkbM family methyltransferase [Desulfobacter latus]|uniref:FkbM family methyltransferase n=1 Tax=Desulfobacter latus TaxID=2292 RepID=A0A850T635_9BACT|nr:FkbM family methyltransferase [Desulfobacter latus]NWH04425.1 FkbM family methyltransferase [Desulfobacter latus]